PPGVDDGAPVSPDNLSIPHPGLRIDGLANCPQQPQAAHLVLSGPLLAPLDKSPDRSRGSIKDVDLVSVDYLPEAVRLRPVWTATVHHLGRAILQRAIHDIAMAGHPSDVGCAPVCILVLEVEYPLGRNVSSDRIAARRVHNSLGLAGRARSIQDVQRMLCIQ